MTRWHCWIFFFSWRILHYVVFLMYNNIFFSFAEGTMETDPGTELPGMPACLHRLWGALSQGKACTCKSKRVWESWRYQLQYSSLVLSDGFLFLHRDVVFLVCNFWDPWNGMLVWSAYPVTFEGQHGFSAFYMQFGAMVWRQNRRRKESDWRFSAQRVSLRLGSYCGR